MTTTLTNEQVARGPRYSMLRRYFATANERYLIWYRRGSGIGIHHDPPWTNDPTWTDDPIFLKYRFCNVYREEDKVTAWLRKTWRGPYREHPNLPFAMALARLINWPPTLEEIGFPRRWKPHYVVDIMNARSARGEKVYTGAYLLGSVPKGVVKAEYLVHDVLSPLYVDLKTKEFSNSTLEGAWEYFKTHRGIGDFLAYEIITDLRRTLHLNQAPDLFTWANAGPGALRGLTRLWGQQPTTRQEQGHVFPKAHAVEAMRLILRESRTRILPTMITWEMREVEHWLCEFDKIERIRHGQGVLERFTPKEAGQW